jgi:hypothetical protein
MKRCIACTLLFSMLLGLCACGDQAASEVSPSPSEDPTDKLMEAATGYSPVEVDVEWTETTLDTDKTGYLLQETDFSTLSLNTDSPGFYTDTVDLTDQTENGQVAVVRRGLDGSILKKVYVDGPTESGEALWNPTFTEDGVWLVRRYLLNFDQDTGEMTVTFTLEHWDSQGTLLCSVPVDESFGEGDTDLTFVATALAPDGTVLALAGMYLYWLDETGTPIHTLALDSGQFHLTQSRDGEVYLCSDGNTLYPILWDSYSLGEPLVSGNYADMICPGAGPYDFLFYDSKTLRGVSIQDATITELVTWKDCDLQDSVNGVFYVDEDTLLIAVYGTLSSGSQELTLSRVLPDQVPETITLTMAVGVAVEGIDWTETNGDLSECVADFNRTNGQYRIEATQFYEPTELNLMIASGDMPDFFCWGELSVDSLLESYRKKGYLLDMTDLFESDPDTTLDHFLPQLVEAATSPDGGIYAMPTKIFCEANVGRPDLVGTESGWSVADFAAAVRAAPEGTWTCDYPALELEGLLSTILDHFVDKETSTCNFRTEEFETLMELCRDYQTEPSDTSQEYTEPYEAVISGDKLLEYTNISSGAAWFASDDLPTIQQNSLTLVGMPGVGGNGVAIFPQQSCSISAISPNQAGAWAFLKKLYGYDFQSGVFQSQRTIRMDAMEAGQKQFLVEFSLDCTQEDLQYALSLMEGGTVVGYQDDTILDIVAEEAEPFMDGSKTLDQVVDVIENRVNIYLSEQE